MAEPRTPITFTLFVLSLAATAEVHLGTLPAPGTGRPGPPNMREAAHLIDVLAMLKAKTVNNLDEQETRLIESVLHDLQMRFVEVQAGEKRVAQP